jgi:low affinity Fe/Cu permease
MTFARIAERTAHAAGHPWSVAASFVLVLAWAFTGPFFGWSEGHQLFINTVTTIITFWLVFLIQATQNRDQAALQAKLDVLIRAIPEAPNRMIGIDRLDEEEVQHLRDKDLLT